MKFIYTGQLPIKDVDLTLNGIFTPEDLIIKGTIFEVPDEKRELIQRIMISGVYEEYIEPKKVGRPKKQQEKGEKQEKEER